jgi:hypothetical protein
MTIIGLLNPIVQTRDRGGITEESRVLPNSIIENCMSARNEYGSVRGARYDCE